MKYERMLKRTLAAVLAGAMALCSLPALSEESQEPQQVLLITVTEAAAPEAPQHERAASASSPSEAPAPEEAPSADIGARAASPAGQTGAEQTETPSEKPDAAVLETTGPEETTAAPAEGMENGEALSETDAPAETAEPVAPLEETDPALPVTEEGGPSEKAADAGDPTISPDSTGEDTPDAYAQRESADPVTVEESLPAPDGGDADPFTDESAAGAVTSGAAEDASVSTELTAKGKGKITSLTRELVNGFTTIRFVIDGRYEGTLCGLAPDTTEEEALAIAKGAAAHLYAGEAGDFNVADAKRYTGLYDETGAVYDEQMTTTIAECDRKLETETDPEKIEEIRQEMVDGYFEIVWAADDLDCYEKYRAWAEDPADKTLRAELDAALSDLVKKSGEAYEASRTYVDVNAVFPGQTALIDAEKTSYINYYLSESERDSALCWAASAADMLWYSGWGAQAVNPQTGENFKSEDELLSWFAESFENSGAKQNTAIQYLFKGITPDAANLGYAGLKEGYLDPEDPYALLAAYAADMLVTSKEGTDAAAEIATMLGALANGSAVGLSVYDMGFTSGHAVTAFGRIVDTKAKNAAAALKALFIADSDSDVPTLSEAEFNGGLLEDGQQQREDRLNTYRMLRTDLYTDPWSGGTSIRLFDYAGKIVAGITVLESSTSEAAADAVESDPAATKNAANTVDLLPTNVGVVAKDTPQILFDSYTEGEMLLAVLKVKDESAVKLPGNTGLPVEFTLYRVDAKTGETQEVAATYSFNWKYAIASNKAVTQSWELGDDLEPGAYLLELSGLNADHTVTEAYYVNNISVDGYRFTIVAIPVPPKPAPEQPAKELPVYSVYATVIDRTDTADIAFRTPDGNGAFKDFTVDTEGAALYYAGEPVPAELWTVVRDASGAQRLVLQPDLMMDLAPGEHVFTLKCKNARVIFTVTVAPPLG